MDKKIYIANWKSHKTKEEANTFFISLKDKMEKIDLSGKEIVIAPPFTLLSQCRYLIEKYNLPVKLAAQNVSPFPPGAYTGEINAKQIKEFAEYVIIGHSERRRYFHETEAELENKIREANEAGLQIVQCVQDENGIVHKGVKIIAYEPPSAIGSGNPDDPEHISYVFKSLSADNSDVLVLYGGSISPDNIKNYLDIERLSGFLIGGASLEVDSFISLLNG